MTDFKHTAGPNEGLISKAGVARDSGYCVHRALRRFTHLHLLHTAGLRSNILSSSQLHFTERAETLSLNLVKISNPLNIGLTAVFRLPTPEALVFHSLQVGLKASSAEERPTGSRLLISVRLVLGLLPDSSSRFNSVLRQLSSCLFQTSSTPEWSGCIGWRSASSWEPSEHQECL